jgi:hypothetical protein
MAAEDKLPDGIVREIAQTTRHGREFVRYDGKQER